MDRLIPMPHDEAMDWQLIILMTASLSIGIPTFVEGSEIENWAFPKSVASWDVPAKESQRVAARKLVASLKTAIAHGDKKFVIPPGDFRFGSDDIRNFDIKAATNLHVNAAGATFWFEPRVRIDAVRIRECKNVRLSGLTIDYDPVAYSQGEIVAIERTDKFVDIQVDPGFPLPDASWTAKSGSIKTIFYDPSGRQREVRMDWVQSLESRGGRLFRVRFKHGWMFSYENAIRLGDRLVLPDRSMRHAIATDKSEAITLEDITVFASPHMALTEVGGKGGNVYRRCKVVRRPETRRLLACNADVFHSIMVEKGPVIEDCEFSHAGDDLINIHGVFCLVLEQRSPTQVVVVQHFGRSFEVGSELAFYNFANLAPQGGAKVKSLTVLDDPALIAAAVRMPADLTQRGDRMQEFHPRNVWPTLVELDRAVTVKKYDLAGCEDRSGQGAIIRSNYFHDGFCRGILTKASHAVVENNKIERIGMAGIAAVAERSWLEGPFPHHVSIRNNTLTDCCAMLGARLRQVTANGAIEVFSVGGREFSPGSQNHHIDITGNRIIRPGACGIVLANARDCHIEHNTIVSASARKPLKIDSGGLKIPGYAIFLAATENVTVEDNSVTAPTPYCAGEIGFGPLVK